MDFTTSNVEIYNSKIISIQNVCFATAVLVIQLHKYSSYLYNSVFFKFKSSNQVIEINIPLTSDTVFNAVYDVLKEKLVISSIEQNISEWIIEWITDNEGDKAAYTIQFKHVSKHVTSHFTCSHNAFFSAVFKTKHALRKTFVIWILIIFLI